MSKGIIIYALNNEQVDYVKIAYHAAKQAKKHLNLPISIITDSADWLKQQYPDYKEVFDILIKIVHETEIQNWSSSQNYDIDSLAFYKGTIWHKFKEGVEKIELVHHEYKDDDCYEKIYDGIDIDKWYPNLPYLKGQHVWYEKNLYRCHTDYEEEDKFSIDKYDIIVGNILDYDDLDEIKIGDKILNRRSLWLKVKDNLLKFKEEDFERVYEGINIDRWYSDLPYLKGQHVYYNNNVYRCEIGYTESDTFSEHRYIIMIENVIDLDNTSIIKKGDLGFHDRKLWISNIDFGQKISTNYNLEDLDPVYQGIDIDKWYPNLPYLAGQHVWNNNTLYRCHTDHSENIDFLANMYDILIENVKDLTSIDKFNKGDILLYNRTLWLSTVNYDGIPNKIRDDIWEDTREREVVFESTPQYRRYFDGSLSFKRLKFKNDIRIKSFELSPYNETLVIDCDYYINNDNLKYCWEQPHDFLIFKESKDLTGYRHDPRLHTVSDKGVDFYWATVFFFKKNKNTETFFNLLGHIQDNWNYYRHVYQIEHSLYRNDYAYSIGIHIMNGYQKGTWAHSLPGSLYYTTDRDLLLEYNETEMKFLLEKEKHRGEYTLIKTNSLNVHVMNKFSLIRLLDQLEKVEYSY
jgi:hypothetical protein